MISISKKLQTQIDKYKQLPRWSSTFPAYVEQHYFDGILVYHKDKSQPDKTYCDTIPFDGAKPTLIIIKFDGQIVFVEYNKSILIDRLPLV